MVSAFYRRGRPDSSRMGDGRGVAGRVAASRSVRASDRRVQSGRVRVAVWWTMRQVPSSLTSERSSLTYTQPYWAPSLAGAVSPSNDIPLTRRSYRPGSPAPSLHSAMYSSSVAQSSIPIDPGDDRSLAASVL